MELLTGKRIGIIGLGLMGGAMAMGLRKEKPISIGAYDINAEVIEAALEQNVIDCGLSDETQLGDFLNTLDIVILCLYPRALVDFVIKYQHLLKAGALLTDIAGVKTMLFDELLPLLRKDLDFIFGHPMAGSEKEGFGVADESIFAGKNYILIPRPENDPEHVALLKKLIYGLGFTNIVETTPEIHDQKIAFTSQLCHIIAAGLIDSEDDIHITDYEGGSFCDLTRIAMINAEMWSELFICNKDALLAQMKKYQQAITKMETLIEAEDEEALIDKLQNVRKKRVAMEIERQNNRKQTSH